MCHATLFYDGTILTELLYHNTEPIHASYVLPIRDDEVLLGRGKEGKSKDRWWLLGGKAEPQDMGDPSVTAARELYEESGIRIDPNHLSLSALIRVNIQRPTDTRIVRGRVYIGHEMEGYPTDTEEKTPGWFKIGHLPRENMHRADYELVGYLLSHRNHEGLSYFASYLRDDFHVALPVGPQDVDLTRNPTPEDIARW